jgi:hypothetical protein
MNNTKCAACSWEQILLFIIRYSLFIAAEAAHFVASGIIGLEETY